uniref:(northern house mosquito) hypothetical protein n=1 Tax=Culex pipiens TaxID=7175 RepID=A0A8D8AVU0_CULPI
MFGRDRTTERVDCNFGDGGLSGAVTLGGQRRDHGEVFSEAESDVGLISRCRKRGESTNSTLKLIFLYWVLIQELRGRGFTSSEVGSGWLPDETCLRGGSPPPRSGVGTRMLLTCGVEQTTGTFPRRCTRRFPSTLLVLFCFGLRSLQERSSTR